MQTLTPERKRELAAKLAAAVNQVALVEQPGDVELLGAELADGTSLTLETLRAGAPGARAKLLAQAKAGEISKLTINATTFIQWPKKSNRKYSRVKPSAMYALASSFDGAPMQKDHDTRQDARGGTVVKCKLVHTDTVDGTEHRLQMKMELVKDWAILGVLDGTIDRWSIQFGRADGEVVCSVHDTPVFTKCYCWRGDKVMVNGAEKVVEFVFTKAEGYEVSAVTVPAVVGTSVDSIDSLRAELSAEGLDLAALACTLGPVNYPKGKPMNELTLIAVALGLSTSSSVDAIIAEVKKISGERDSAEDARDVALEQVTAAHKERDGARAELAAHATAALTAKVEATLVELKAAGKLTAGGKAEAALRRMAARDFDAFDAHAAELLESGAAVTPAGPRQTRPAPAPAATPGGGGDRLAAKMDDNPLVGSWLSAAGFSREQANKHAAGAFDMIDALEEAGR